MAVYKVHDENLVLATPATAFSFLVPEGAKEVLFRLADSTVAWRWSTRESEIDAGRGMTMLQGEAVTWDGPVSKQTIFVAHDGTGSKDLRRSFLYPRLR